MLNNSKSFGLLLSVFIAVLVFTGCARLPVQADRDFEPALLPSQSGSLADLAHRFAERYGPQRSGFYLLLDSREALDARLALIDSAERSIDLQYFIWKGDETGVLLFSRLFQAADRGVKVRAIVDDIWLGSSTRTLAVLNAHPNLEIRIFNPNPYRDHVLGGMLHQLASYQEMNRRMHNKLMIADNLALIAGGRNIANEYFGLGVKFNFVDIDVLTVGPVVEESSHAFDKYWNNNAVYAVKKKQNQYTDVGLDDVLSEVAKLLEKSRPRLTSFTTVPTDWKNWFASIEQNFKTGTAHFLQDDPIHIENESYRLLDMISYVADPTESELILSSPYLLPVDNSLDKLKENVERGINVKLLTNSLASTNHTLVNSHYKKYRRPILDRGARLYEFRHQPSRELREKVDVDPVAAPFISLHAKAIVADKQRSFIGSLNFDPRAIVINSENGLLINSRGLSTQLADFLLELMEPENSWHVTYNHHGNGLEWKSADGVKSAQPARGLLQSISDIFGILLPIESQL